MLLWVGGDNTCLLSEPHLLPDSLSDSQVTLKATSEACSLSMFLKSVLEPFASSKWTMSAEPFQAAACRTGSPGLFALLVPPKIWLR